MKRKIAFLLMIVLAALCLCCCGKDKYETSIESVNIHYSGGFSGRYDDDLTIYRSGDRYFIKFRTNHQDTTGDETSTYQISREEFVKCTEMLNIEKLSSLGGASACDAIYYTVTIKEEGEDEIELPRTTFFGFNPYQEIEKMYEIKAENSETDWDRFDFKVWECFRENEGTNGFILSNDQHIKRREELYGLGFGSYYGPGLDECFGQINDELLSEIEMAQFYEDGKLDSLELNKSPKERREIVSSIKGKAFRSLAGGNYLYRDDLLFFFGYSEVMFRDYGMSTDCLNTVLNAKYNKTVANGKDAYTRTVVSGDVFAVIVIVPEDEASIVYLSDSYSRSYAKKITKLLLEQLS